MALRFCDSFDHYATADMTSKYVSVSNTTIGAFGRNGTNGARVSRWDFGFNKTLDSQATWIVGSGIRLTSYTTTAVIFGLRDSGAVQVDLRIDTTGHLYVTRNGTVLGSAGSTILAFNTYYYVEFKATIHDSTGSVSVRINGNDEITLTNQDTQNTANATANQIYFLGAGSAITVSFDFDDLYVCDGTGGVNDDFLGDVRVQTILPSGNGNSSQFDGSDGNQVDNYLLVDEATPNSDTDYVESPDVNDKDTYAYGNVTPTTGDVFGLQILPHMRKTDAGSRSAVSVARESGGTEADSAAKSLTTTYQYLPDIRQTKPSGGAWTITEVNGAEFGVKVSA